MNEEEIELGKIAYEAYIRSQGWMLTSFVFAQLHQDEQQAWIAAAKAVAERVIAEMRTAEEASE